MGGVNPYIKNPKSETPTRKFKITFENQQKTVEVDPAAIPYGTGLPGSVLDIALGAGIDIDHACDIACACTTCHVIIREGFKTIEPSDDTEDDLLDKAWGLEPNSRLSCQAIIGNDDLVIEIPKYSINMAKEGHR